MRGFLLSMESVLALLILVSFLLQFFIPLPNTASILRFIEVNDRFTAELEATGASSYVLYTHGMDCTSIRYVPNIHGTTVLIVPVCVR